jgi:pyruvate dehydrogenase E2 component (dihydrolipoamide acetyltransferase)
MITRLAFVRNSMTSNRAALQRWFSTEYPPHEIIAMSALSPTMEFGGIARWVKHEGEGIGAGDIVVEIETDKATIDFEAQDDTFLAKILVPAGTSDLPVGTPLAITCEEESDIAAFANASADEFSTNLSSPPSSPQAPSSEPAAPPPTPPPIHSTQPPATATAPGGRVVASPAARRIARENGVSVSGVGVGTGPNGRIVAADVTAYVASGGSATAGQATMGAGVDFAHTATRHNIAERLTRAKQEVPHYYLTVDVDLTEVMRMRDQLKKERSIDISVHDFVLKASATAMDKVPDVNASWMDSFIRQYSYVDVNVAVNTERGLVMPIVRNLNTTSLLDLSQVRSSFISCRLSILFVSSCSSCSCCSPSFVVSNMPKECVLCSRL